MASRIFVIFVTSSSWFLRDGYPLRTPPKRCNHSLVESGNYAERIRELALSFPDSYEDEPWGFPVFKVGANRMFAWLQMEGGTLRVTVKLTAEEREVARLLPYVSKARYVGRYGWVTAEVTDDESFEAALEWIRESYWLRAPANLRRAVEEHDT
jgi:predicted DNA-binding protein (MmcQ/YjbR family)